MLSTQSCEENPTAVGVSLLRQGDFSKLRIDTLSAAISSTIATPINTDGSDQLLVGKYPGYNAISVVTFTGLPAGKLDTVSIIDAKIVLRAVYHFGDDPAPLAFQGYQAAALTDSATYDSLIMRPSDYYFANPILTFPPTIVNDTTTIECLIDTGIVHNWFTIPGTLTNYGVVLIATNVNTIKGFASFANDSTSYAPALVVDCIANGTQDTITYITGESHFFANIALSDLVSPDPQSMYVQSGVAYRAQLDFNLDTLPKAALIVKAQLELTPNVTHPITSSNLTDTLYSYFVNPDSTIVAQPVESQTVTVGSSTVYWFAVADYVRSWAKGDTLQRLQFAGLRETNSLDRYALYGTRSPADVRPRLIVTYILP